MQISEEQAQEVTMHERRIEQTRHAMTDTVSALQERLSPGAIAGNAGNAMKEATVGQSGRMLSGLTDRIKSNPVPSALVGAGLVWMFIGGRKPNHDGNGWQRLSGAAQRSPISKAGDQVAQLSDSVGSVAETASETARTQFNQLSNQAQRAQTSFQRALEQNPLPVALVAAGLGAVMATALPTTDAESRLMQPVGDQLTQQAKDLGHKVGQVAERAQSAAREEAGRQNLS